MVKHRARPSGAQRQERARLRAIEQDPEGAELAAIESLADATTWLGLEDPALPAILSTLRQVVRGLLVGASSSSVP
eukprot:14975377-Heterocapsa_arctica.AAC.1